jgi:hypothetical protein
MLKFLIISILFFYVLVKGIGLIFRLLGFPNSSQYHGQQGQRRSEHTRKGKVNVDYVPKQSRKEHLKGGEYIDYEEIKD